MPTKSAKDKHEQRQASKKLAKKEKYSRAFAVASGSLKTNKNEDAKTGTPQSQKQKKSKKHSVLEVAYIRAGESGNDISEAGKWLFERLLIENSAEFFEDVQESTFAHVEHQDEEFYSELLSGEELRNLLNEGKVSSDDVTLTKWNGTELETKPYWNKSWEADFKSGWTVRVRNSQPHLAKIWRVCSLLEAFIGATIDAELVWMNSNATGIAAHFDGQDCFVLQCEGKSSWTLRTLPEGAESDVFPDLPTEPSREFVEEELADLEIQFEDWLETGDLLYFPRGWVNSAKVSSVKTKLDKDEHSLMILLRLGTNTMTWADLIEKVLMKALQASKLSDVRLRGALPKDFASFMGAQHTENSKEETESEKGLRRAAFELEALKLVKSTVMKSLNVDAGADDLMARFMEGRLRPALQDDDDDFVEEDDIEVDVGKLGLNSQVELRAKDTARICVENGMAVVRHCMKNTRVRFEVEERGIEFDLDDASTVEAALAMDDGPFSIGSLPEVMVEEGEEPEENGGRTRVVGVMLNEGILRLVKY